MNLLLQGDNVRALAQLRGPVTLAYLDPPFFTQRVHRMPDGRMAFDDRWSGLGAYLDALSGCLRGVWHVLASSGCVVIHVDSKVSHYVKVTCDRLFGADAFASEIVWRYRRWPTKTSNFQRVHDVLLRYRRDPDAPPRWNQLFEPLAESTLETWGTKAQRARMRRGRRVRSETAEAESQGVPMGDVWDIGVIAPSSPERTGFPTQKPEALLERLVLALTDPGDVVLDPYAGSGTALVVAARLGRFFIGIDQSEAAIEVTRARLGDADVVFQRLGAAA